MKKIKAIVALVLAVIIAASCFAVPVAAATSNKGKIVKWSCLNPSSATPNEVSYTIKGNLLSQKKVTFVSGNTNLDFNYDTKSINFYKNNTRFRVDIYKNGTWQRAYTGTLGQYFYLPKGASNYTVVVKTYFNNWTSNTTCHLAAQVGTYYLKY